MSKYTIRDYVPDLPIDYAEDPYGTAYRGLFRQTVELDGVSREIVTFVPDDYRAQHKGALIFVPAGVSAEDFVNASKWVECAKRSLLRRFLLKSSKLRTGSFF